MTTATTPAASFDPALVTIERKRFSLTQGEVLLLYAGQRLDQYGDAIALRDGEWRGYSDEFLLNVAKREAIERGLASEPAPVPPATPRQRVTLDALAIGDTLFRSAANTLAKVDCFTVPALDYVTRKRKAIRATYFRQRTGRDYWTGLPKRERMSTAFAAAYRCGHDDELSGAPSTSAPRIHTTGPSWAYYERGRRDALASLIEARS